MVDRRRAVQREGAKTPEVGQTQADGGTPLVKLPASAGNGAITRLWRSDREGAPTQAPDDFASRLGTESGQEIPGGARRDLEAGLGVPLDGVRVHTGPGAAALSAEVSAHAFTVGQDIYFGQGKYDPASRAGYRLLAHEVTHTGQQSAAPQLSSGLAVSSPRDHAELEAHAAADHLAAHRGSTADPVSVGIAGSPLVARHDSWEHTLLGDTPPSELAAGTGTAVTVEARKHLLTDLWQRTEFFAQNPDGDPRAKFPNVRWIQFKTSGMWASNGEVNALADYLPDPAAADTMTRDELIPVLQKMRSGTMHNTGNPYDLNVEVIPTGDMPVILDKADTQGMATSWLEYLSEAGGEVKAIDNATAQEGVNRYA